MTNEQKEIISNLFTRYGNPSREREIRITDYLIHPEDLNDLKRVEYYDSNTERTIKELEKMIEQLKIYRIALCEQYNYLSTAPTEKIIKLKREKRENKVFYYLLEIEKNIDNGKEKTIKSTKYTGKDRRKAFDDFLQYIKSHPGVTAIEDTEKGIWEK